MMNLVPASTLKAHHETVLALAAEPLLGQVGFTFIAVAAVLSTGSALNATLSSASRLSAQISEATAGDAQSPDTVSATDGGDNLSPYSQSTPTHRSPGTTSDTAPPACTIIIIGSRRFSPVREPQQHHLVCVRCVHDDIRYRECPHVHDTRLSHEYGHPDRRRRRVGRCPPCASVESSPDEPRCTRHGRCHLGCRTFGVLGTETTLNGSPVS